MNKRRLYGLIVIAAIILAVGFLLTRTGRVVAPVLHDAQTPSLSTQSSLSLSVQDKIEIYSTVVRDIGKREKVIYILDTTDDRNLRPISLQTEPVSLSNEILTGILVALDDLSPRVTSLENFPVEDDASFRRVKDGGAVVTLGNLKVDGLARVKLGARIYRTGVNGAGYSITMEKINDVWTMVDMQVTSVS